MAGSEPTPDHSPYADPETLPELVDEARSAVENLEAVGVDLHPDHHLDAAPKAAPVEVSEQARHLSDGMPDYGG
jgi:hypothetical protein